MHHIRPYKIFTLIETPPRERVVNVALPCRRAAGGTTLLETFLIIAAIQIVGAKRVFEFGTFLGSNTLNMALNTPPGAEVFTLDLDEHSAAEAEQHPADAPFTRAHLTSRLDFAGSAVAEKIKTLRGNSTTFDFSAWQQAVDFVFIDGGHDLRTVRSDTENAMAMAAIAKSSCVMWHDYGNNEYPELTGYLDDLAKERAMLHVENTMLCAWFNDPEASIVPRLLASL